MQVWQGLATGPRCGGFESINQNLGELVGWLFYNGGNMGVSKNHGKTPPEFFHLFRVFQYFHKNPCFTTGEVIWGFPISSMDYSGDR